jgi:PHP family Zn ribbon phosphoesterase
MTPVFNQLRTEHPEAPLCRICNHVWLNPWHGDTCNDCFIRNRDHPEAHREWHCNDCGEFIDGLDRMVFQTGTHSVVFVCREHFNERYRSTAA